MNYVPVFRPIVQQEMDEAYAWYEERSPELADDFLACVYQQVDLVCQMPEAYRLIYRDVRRTLVKRFPYAIQYRIVSSRIIIIAVVHMRKNPRTVRSRS
jgi:plasmid stabilization system protein ParE